MFSQTFVSLVVRAIVFQRAALLYWFFDWNDPVPRHIPHLLHNS